MAAVWSQKIVSQIILAHSILQTFYVNVFCPNADNNIV